MIEPLASRIYVRSHLEGTFRLRSGATSREYFDKYRFESDPQLLREIAGCLVRMLPADIDALAGLELGGVPIATAMSQLCGLPALFVHKEPKTYGTCRLAEGDEVAGRRLAIVEDVVTSADQVIESCRRLRELDAVVDVAVCVIDREAGALENLASEAVELRALFSTRQLQASVAKRTTQSVVAKEAPMSVAEARELAIRTHANQHDRDGSLHVDHLARVAESVPSDDAHQRVAWLHDIIEDSEVSSQDLQPVLPADELDAICLLTHDDAVESYRKYVTRIVAAPGPAGELARTVKQADMLDNLHRCVRGHDPAVARYGQALSQLWGAGRS